MTLTEASSAGSLLNPAGIGATSPSAAAASSSSLSGDVIQISPSITFGTSLVLRLGCDAVFAVESLIRGRCARWRAAELDSAWDGEEKSTMGSAWEMGTDLSVSVVCVSGSF